MKKSSILYGAWGVVVVAVSIVLGIWVSSDILDDRPMPCTEHQVYVWQDYPDMAVCLSDTDHEGHMGHTG